MTEFIISLKPEYLDLMLSGEKTIELRKRPLHLLSENSNVWVYGTLPLGAIAALATVKNVLRMSPVAAWKSYRTQIAITKKEYSDYVADSEHVSLVFWEKVKPLSKDFSLSEIRQKDPCFQPPQFYSQFSPPRILKQRRR